MSLLKALEKVADVVTDAILLTNPGTRKGRSLKAEQAEAIDSLSEMLRDEASFFTGRQITEDELIEKGKEFNAKQRRHKQTHRSRCCNATDNSSRPALADTSDSGRFYLPYRRD